MDIHDAKKRLLAAQTLLMEPTSSFEKFGAVKKLVAGIHPQLDAALERAALDLQPIEQILGRDFFSFAAENLPEVTEEQKKRKKYVVLFWKTWNTLRGEVSRVQQEMNQAQSSGDQVVKSSHWGRIFNFAKGPFGILTLVAIALVSASAYTSVKIVIINQGCPTMIPSSSVPNFIPGISLPTEPIGNGSSAVANIPALPMTADGGVKGVLTLNSLKFHMSFQLGDIKEVQFDSKSLMGKVTDLNLSGAKAHQLVFICK